MKLERLKVLKTSCKRFLLLSSILSFLSFCPFVSAEENNFPGQGNIADWKKASVEYDLAYECKVKKQWGNAIDHLRRAISIYPFDAHYYACRSSCYSQIGEPRNAIADIGKALSLKQHALYWLMAADYFAECSDFTKCCKALNSAVAMKDPSTTTTLAERGARYFAMCEDKSMEWPNTKEKLTLADLGVVPSPQYVPDRWSKTIIPPGAQGIKPGMRWTDLHGGNPFDAPGSTGKSPSVPTDIGNIPTPSTGTGSNSLHKFPSPWESPSLGKKDKK